MTFWFERYFSLSNITEQEFKFLLNTYLLLTFAVTSDNLLFYGNFYLPPSNKNDHTSKSELDSYPWCKLLHYNQQNLVKYYYVCSNNNRLERERDILSSLRKSRIMNSFICFVVKPSTSQLSLSASEEYIRYLGHLYIMCH